MDFMESVREFSNKKRERATKRSRSMSKSGSEGFLNVMVSWVEGIASFRPNPVCTGSISLSPPYSSRESTHPEISSHSDQYGLNQADRSNKILSEKDPLSVGAEASART